MPRTSKASHQIRIISIFWMFVQSPVAVLKCSNICFKLATSTGIGLRKIATSSAYKLVLILTGLAPIGCTNPTMVAMFSNFCNGSIARIKSIGDKGSLCQSPCPCLMGRSGCPFRIIHDDVELHISAMISRHRWSNPSCCITSRRYSHLTVSKAFVMSSFTKSIKVFNWWN
jgi:hypothetical protein